MLFIIIRIDLYIYGILNVNVIDIYIEKKFRQYFILRTQIMTWKY